MTVEMSQEELELVEELIQERLIELGPEIRRTDSRQYRDDLKHLRDRLLALKQKLMSHCAA